MFTCRYMYIRKVQPQSLQISLKVCMFVYISCKKYVFHVTSQHAIIPLTQDGSTPVNVASENGHSDVVKILIRSGADINLI